MFFPEKITLIKPHHRVLEVGPGATPYSRANVLLELRYDTDRELARQSGVTTTPPVDARTVHYTGGAFPFINNEFDYVVCSHVIEHVEDVELFCSELFRVAKSGYVEYPLAYYEYVFDIPEHVNLIKWDGNALYYAKKSVLLPSDTKPLSLLWFNALSAGYTETVADLVPHLMEGFEWTQPFALIQANSLNNLVHAEINIHRKQQRPGPLWKRVGNRLKNYLISR